MYSPGHISFCLGHFTFLTRAPTDSHIWAHGNQSLTLYNIFYKTCLLVIIHVNK